MNFKELEIIALNSVIKKDLVYYYRKICRYYSETFHTPLMEVYKLPFNHVATNYYEHILENIADKERFYNLVVDIAYPEKRVQEEEKLQADIDRWVKEDEEKQKKKAEKQKKLEEEKDEEIEIEMSAEQFLHLEDEID